MRLRAFVVAAIVAAVLGTVGLASIGRNRDDIDRPSYRASIELTGDCRTPPIVVGDRTFLASEAAPQDRLGVVDGTLWITGSEGLFVAQDGNISLRYTLAEDGVVAHPTCVVG
jgi:hypothetical protein